jgi:hypothetical protein
VYSIVSSPFNKTPNTSLKPTFGGLAQALGVSHRRQNDSRSGIRTNFLLRSSAMSITSWPPQSIFTKYRSSVSAFTRAVQHPLPHCMAMRLPTPNPPFERDRSQAALAPAPQLRRWIPGRKKIEQLNQVELQEVLSVHKALEKQRGSSGGGGGSSRPSYEIEVSHNDELFVINGEKFEAKTYCFNMEEGDRVIFIDGSALGACASATLINLRTKQKCEVWCE